MKKRIGITAACFTLIISLLPLTAFANELPPEVSGVQEIAAIEEVAKSEMPDPAMVQEDSTKDQTQTAEVGSEEETTPGSMEAATPAEAAIDETLVPEAASEESAKSEAVTEDVSEQEEKSSSAQEETLPESSETGRSMHTQGGYTPSVEEIQAISPNNKVDPLLTSIKVNDLELTAGTVGRVSHDHDPDTGEFSPYYYLYTPAGSKDLNITITYNGTVYSGSAIEIAEQLNEVIGFYCVPDIITDQNYNNQWTAGNTYQATLKLLGHTATFNVTIKESLLTYIAADDVEIYEGTFVSSQVIDYNTGKVVPGFARYYPYSGMKMTIVYDGIEYYGTPYQLGEKLQELIGYWIEPFYNDDQSYDNQWTGGNTYKATTALLGKTAEFNVTIKKQPITSFKINDIKITEGTNGAHNGSFFRYNFDNIPLSVDYNGMSYNGTAEMVNRMIDDSTNWHNPILFFDDQTLVNGWQAGKTYTVKASYRGMSTTFKVTIVKNKLTEYKVDDLFIMERTAGYSMGDRYHYFVTPATVSVTYNGKKYYGQIEDVVKRLQKDTGFFAARYVQDNQSLTDPWEAGKTYTVKAFFMDKSCNFKVTILKSKVAVNKTKISLSKTSYTFNGKALTPAVTVKYGTSTLVKDRDYSVKYTANKNAGTATVTITGKGGFTGTVKKTFKIAKAANTITKVTASKTLKKASLAKKAQAFNIAATVKGSAKKSFAMLKSTPAKAKKYIKVSSAGKVTVKKGTPKGTYNIKVKITAKATANYTAKSLTKTIKIVVK